MLILDARRWIREMGWTLHRDKSDLNEKCTAVVPVARLDAMDRGSLPRYQFVQRFDKDQKKGDMVWDFFEPGPRTAKLIDLSRLGAAVSFMRWRVLACDGCPPEKSRTLM